MNSTVCRSGTIWTGTIKTSLIIALFAAVLAAFAFGTASPAFAEETAEPLNVYYDNELLKSFTMEDLEQIWQDEGSKQYTYSGFNTYPTEKTVEKAEGPTVRGVLQEALGETGQTFDEIGDQQMIEFISGDGNSEGFLKEQLFRERWYFPQFGNESGRNGKAVTEGSADDPVSVPPIISLKENGKTYGKGSGYNISDDVGRLLIGQNSPHEQCHAAYLKYLSPASNGTHSIVIHSGSADQWNAIQTVTGETENAAPGTELGFDKDVNEFKSGRTAGRYWIYYTMDGTDPTLDSDIYNYNSFGGSSQKYNSPVTPSYGRTEIRVMVSGYGKLDSDVSSFVIEAVPAAPQGLLAKAGGYGSVKLSWNAVDGAENYEIYRSTSKNSGFAKVKSETGTAWTNTGLKTGTAYYYKVLANAKAADGTDVPGGFSAVVSARPVLAKPVMKTPAVKGRTITVKWSKVAGANGYKIYRAVKKTGTYKLVKTVRSGGTLSWKNSGLKKNKTYYYKIRAYRNVSGKPVCSSYSAVKYKKTK